MNHTKDARRIGLVDVDGHNGFPNLALMRISAWHKALGDMVEWWDGMLPYDFARHYDADAQLVVGTDYYPETGREVISYLRTGAVGVGTPRGVKVGDSEKALLTEYPEALYCIAADESELYDGYSDESGYSEPAYDFDRAYVWQPQTPQDDGNYDVRDIAFYLKDGTVSAITMTKLTQMICVGVYIPLRLPAGR